MHFAGICALGLWSDLRRCFRWHESAFRFAAFLVLLPALSAVAPSQDQLLPKLIREGQSAIEAGDFVVDEASHSVEVTGKPIHLTPKEFDLLVHLARHAGKVITHRALLTAVWGAQSVHQPEYLRVFVGQLRKKLENETGKQYIQTEPWVGYRFLPEGWLGKEEQS